MASSCRIFLTLFLVGASLGLFFGLFFGLNYPEVVRNGWPATRCTVLSITSNQRYCCESKCNRGCTTAFSVPTCGTIISQINNNFDPQACAANSTACPPSFDVCDGGYFCCSTCCQTCRSCSTSCTGSGSSQSCSQSCTSTKCNCTCCNQTFARACTLSCPACSIGVARLSYTPYGGTLQEATYTQNFGKNTGAAREFELRHPVNSTSFCYYNPQNFEQVTFDIAFTAWKWGITAAFGMLPLLATISYLAYRYIIKPCLGSCSCGWRSRSRAPPMIAVHQPEPSTGKEHLEVPAPPPYEPSRRSRSRSRSPSPDGLRPSIHSRASSRRSNKSVVKDLEKADREDGETSKRKGDEPELPRTSTI